MTISSDTNKIAYPGDNATVEFIYDFLVPLVADMTVVLDDVIQSTGYTVNGAGNDAGGDVTFDVAPGAGVKITLIRELNITQEMDLRPYDAFPADTVEDAFDKLTMISQDIQEQVDRSVIAPASDDGSTDYTMPVFQAGSAITWDDPTKQLVNSDFPLQQYVDDAATSEANAAASAAQAAARSSDAQLRAWDSEANQLTSDSYATQAEDVFVTVYTSNGDGTFTATPTTDYSALHWSAKALENAAEGEANTSSNLGGGEGLAATKAGIDLPFKSLVAGANISLASDANTVTVSATPAATAGQANIPARNCTLNQTPVTQALSSEAGQESLLGIATSAVDTTTGDRGFIRFSKDRNNVSSWVVSDSIMGAFHLQSDTTSTKIAGVPAVNADDVTYTFQTNKKDSGTTNRGKAYTCHYNVALGVSAISYDGDALAGHELPHNLSREPELSIFKAKDVAGRNWGIKHTGLASGYTGTNQLFLDTDAAQGTVSDFVTTPSTTTITLDGANALYNAAEAYESYHFVSIPGTSKVSTYTGTGTNGNTVECGFPLGWLMVKNVSTTADWIIVDIPRDTGTYVKFIRPNLSAIEGESAALDILFTPTGFTLQGSDAAINAVNNRYIYVAFAETTSDVNKTYANYNYPTNADTLEIVENSLLSFANGFDAEGQLDTQENVGPGITHVLGVGFESKTLWLYKDLAGSYGTTEIEPVEGLTKGAATGDYYLVEEGVMYNSSDVAIERIYLASVITDADGDVAIYENLSVAKQKFNDVDVHGDLVVTGTIQNDGIASTAVSFDGTQSPPVILSSFGVTDIVDLGTGNYQIVAPDVDFRLAAVTTGFTQTLTSTEICRTITPANGSIGIQIVNDLSQLVDSSFVNMISIGGKN